jgi:hypothetical protein
MARSTRPATRLDRLVAIKLRTPNSPNVRARVDDATADEGLDHRGFRDLLSRNRERIAIENDEVGELPDLERARDVVLVQFVGGVDGCAAQDRHAGHAGTVAEPAAVFARRVRRARARDPDLNIKPFVERVDGPVAAERDAGASRREQSRGFEDLHACRAEIIPEAEGITRRLPPLERQHRDRAQLLETREVGERDDLGVRDSRTDIGARQGFAQGAYRIERRTYGPVAVRMCGSMPARPSNTSAVARDSGGK